MPLILALGRVKEGREGSLSISSRLDHGSRTAKTTWICLEKQNKVTTPIKTA